jgi:hypothetical protein
MSKNEGTRVEMILTLYAEEFKQIRILLFCKQAQTEYESSDFSSYVVLCYEGLLRFCARKKFRRKEGLLLINAAIV